MDIPSAELTKYAANAMLATRISFMNQMADLCERVGADVTSVGAASAPTDGSGRRSSFPVPGYGGSCFPKDVQALVRTAGEFGVVPDLLEAVEAVNARQKQVLLQKVMGLLGASLTGRAVGVWGLAFKPETDDMRESPAIPLVEGLLAAGATVRVHDPKAMEVARELFGDRVSWMADPYEACRGTDALVIVTEWLVYRTPDFERMRDAMRRPADCRWSQSVRPVPHARARLRVPVHRPAPVGASAP